MNTIENETRKTHFSLSIPCIKCSANRSTYSKKKKKRRSKYLKSIEFVELEIYCLLMYRELAIINTTFGPSLGYHLVQD